MENHQGDHKNHLMILMVTTTHCLTQQMYSPGTHVAEVRELYYMGIDFLVRKLDQLKVEKLEREDNE